MTRRATVLDALEPAAIAAVSRGTIAKLGIKPGDMVRVSTRRGTVELNSRQDDAIPDGVVFIPFAFVEAAANMLTNPALDPFGKIPEFKFCAAKVEAAQAADGSGGVGADKKVGLSGLSAISTAGYRSKPGLPGIRASFGTNLAASHWASVICAGVNFFATASRILA